MNHNELKKKIDSIVESVVEKAINEVKYEKGEEKFIVDKTISNLKIKPSKGKTYKDKSNKTWKFINKDEYPKGTSGWWVRLIKDKIEEADAVIAKKKINITGIDLIIDCYKYQVGDKFNVIVFATVEKNYEIDPRTRMPRLSKDKMIVLKEYKNLTEEDANKKIEEINKNGITVKDLKEMLQERKNIKLKEQQLKEKVDILIEKIINERIKINETGEWVWDDDQTAWAEALKSEVKRIEKETKGKIKLIDVKGFDNYQGPYAIVKYKNKQYKIWTLGNSIDNELWIENFIIDNTSDHENVKGFKGTTDELIDMLKNINEDVNINPIEQIEDEIRSEYDGNNLDFLVNTYKDNNIVKDQVNVIRKTTNNKNYDIKNYIEDIVLVENKNNDREGEIVYEIANDFFDIGIDYKTPGFKREIDSYISDYYNTLDRQTKSKISKDVLAHEIHKIFNKKINENINEKVPNTIKPYYAALIVDYNSKEDILNGKVKVYLNPSKYTVKNHNSRVSEIVKVDGETDKERIDNAKGLFNYHDNMTLKDIKDNPIKQHYLELRESVKNKLKESEIKETSNDFKWNKKIDFSFPKTDKYIKNGTEEYDLLSDLEGSNWEEYIEYMMSKGANIEYDLTNDRFIIKSTMP
jgi:hypothetical protein